MCERDIDEKHVYSRLTHIFVSQTETRLDLLDYPSPHNNCYFLIISFSLSSFFILFRFLCLFIYTCCNWKEDASFCCCCRHNMILKCAVNFCIFFISFFFTARTIANAELKGKEKREAATLARATS